MRACEWLTLAIWSCHFALTGSVCASSATSAARPSASPTLVAAPRPAQAKRPRRAAGLGEGPSDLAPTLGLTEEAGEAASEAEGSAAAGSPLGSSSSAGAPSRPSSPRAPPT
eukprot:8094057-Pyramimonas_sp.AAC.2